MKKKIDDEAILLLKGGGYCKVQEPTFIFLLSLVHTLILYLYQCNSFLRIKQMKIRYKSKNEQEIEHEETYNNKAEKLLSQYRIKKKQNEDQSVEFENEKLQSLKINTKKQQNGNFMKQIKVKYRSLKNFDKIGCLRIGMNDHMDLEFVKSTYNLTFEKRKFWSVQPIHLKQDNKYQLIEKQQQKPKNIRSRKVQRQTQRYSSESCQKLRNTLRLKLIPKKQVQKGVPLQISGLKAPTSQMIDHLNFKKTARSRFQATRGSNYEREHYFQFFQ